MISFDTNIIIYALDRSSPFFDEASKIVRQGDVEGAILSTLALQEILVGAQSTGSEDTVNFINAAIKSFTGITFQPVTEQIARLAAELTRDNRKIRQYDAVHIASAITSGASIFYTNDKSLHSGVEGIEIRSL